MNEKNKEEVFLTLNRLTKVISESPLLQSLSNVVQIGTSVVGGAVRDLYLDKQIKDIDIAITLDFKQGLNIIYPKREERYYRSREIDDDIDREYWGRATAEADALKSRNYDIIKKLEKPEYSIIHEFMEQHKKDLSAIDAVVFLIRKIIENHNDYKITQVFDKTTLDIIAPNPKLNDIPYENMGLCAVVGIKDKNTDYPIELLFTTDEPLNFTKCFDFNLCKIYMENKCNEAVITPTEEFLKDVENKTITYTPPTANLDEKKINKSLLVRYERFQKKFPDFKLVSEITDVNDDMKLLIEKTISMINLGHELKANDNNSPPKTIKRTQKI